MNYEQIYYTLCERSKQRIWEKFTYEKHHILPKSMGGSDAKSNIAILTPREHALAHLLLVRFLKGENKAKMIFAIKSMLDYRNKNRKSLTPRQYEVLRKTFAEQSRSVEYSQYRSEITKKQWTKERRESVSEKTKKQWENGIKRSVFASDDYRQLKTKQMKERWQQEEYQKEMSERAIEQWQDPYKKPNRGKKVTS